MIASVRSSAQNRTRSRSCHRKFFRSTAFFSIVSLLAAFAPAASAQDVWYGGAGTTNWSTPANWSFGGPPSTVDDVLFDNFVVGSASNLVDNIVDANFTIAGLDYQTIATNGFHTTLVNPGVSLNINGGAALQRNPPFLGTGADPGADLALYCKVGGGGTLSVAHQAGQLVVGPG